MLRRGSCGHGELPPRLAVGPGKPRLAPSGRTARPRFRD
ncbi:hypothetical protein LG3211_3771 [Lysobacter gummosus]|nr:hypothetical protein LG3211_3771 [Lysobacter gummosus]